MTSFFASGIPAGSTFTYNQTINYTPTPAASIITAGGSFTTLNLNITAQTPRWKAYVGNVTGIMTLDDGSGKSIYDWTPGVIQGEVYATRNTTPQWANVGCGLQVAIDEEQTALNINATAADSVNNTFVNMSHKGFYTGVVPIANSTCRSIATYVNDTRQAETEAAVFQELILSDPWSMIYVTLIENNQVGFNNMVYDFQLIVPNDEYAGTPTTYYFYAEIG
jgi:hypothetical protein